MRPISTRFVLLLFLIQVTQLASQNFQFTKSIGGVSQDETKAIAVDGSGNIYAAGRFQGTADLDPGPAIFTVTSNGNFDIFIVKLNASGNLIWAETVGGTTADAAWDLTIDASSNVYVTGYFSSLVDFDPGVGTYTLNASASGDGYVLKLNSLGNFVWAKNFTGSNNVEVNSVAVDVSGNVLLTGIHGGGGFTDFDPGPGTYTLGNAGTLNDIFVCSLNNSGNFSWAISLGNTGQDGGNCVTSDPNGDVYVTGRFFSSVDFDAGPGSMILTSGVQHDIFIIKYSSAGSFIFAKQMGGNGYDIGNSIFVDNSNNIYTTGYYETTADFDPGPSTYNLTGGTNFTSFISKLDNFGNFSWAKAMVGNPNNGANDITVDLSGNVHVTGFYNGSVDLDPGPGTFTLTTPSGNDIYYVRLNNSGNFLSGFGFGGTSNDQSNSVVVDSSYNLYFGGTYLAIADFDPSPSTFTISSSGSSDGFISKFCLAPNQPLSIGGGTMFCSNALPVFTISSVLSATSYSWTLPAGWIGSSTVTSISPTITAPGGNVLVSAVNSCGSSSSQTLAVVINPLPNVSVNSGSICSGNTFSITPNGANTYTIQGGNSIVSPTTNTSYTVVGTSSAGCISSSVAVCGVTVNQLPNISIASSNSVICVGQTVALTAAGGITYTWSTSNSVNPEIVAPTVTTTYSVTGEDLNGCKNSASISQSVSTCSGIYSGKITSGSLFKIYPNPSNGIFYISTEIKENITVEFFDVSGRNVRTVDLIQDQQINVDLLENGIYFLSIKHGIINEKVLISILK